MTEHHVVRDTGRALGQVVADAFGSIFSGVEHHEPWEAAVARWDAEHPGGPEAGAAPPYPSEPQSRPDASPAP